jgi:dTDP-3-amino-3,4,6-trideoxy-alpha-D-glucose transaminase
LPVVPAGADPAWHLYAVGCHGDPEAVRARLAEHGIESRGYYRTPVHRQPAMARFADDVELPATEEFARSNLALPISSAITAEQVAEVAAALAASS